MINIRKANSTDISNIYQCNKETLPLYYSIYEYYYFLFLTNDTELLVAEDNGKLCGYLFAQVSGTFIHIMSFGIYKQYRRQGIGSLFIDKLEEIMKQERKEIIGISLNVHADNVNGINFYKKNGFINTNTLKNYYDGNIKNAISQDAFKFEKLIIN